MKKFICTLLFLATSWVTGWAADKLPSLCDEWNMLMVYYPEGFDHYRTKKIRLTTDTIINDTSYVKLQQGDGYIGALREDNDANIFYIPAQSTHEYLLYAFHAHVGDVLSNLWIGGNPAYHPNIDKITVTDISNTTPRVFTITLDYTYGNDYQGKEIIEWIEGIGLMEGPAGSDCISIDGCGGDAYQTLLCAYKNGEQIYVSDKGEKYGCDYRKPLEVSITQASTWYGIRYFHEYPQKEHTPLITNIAYKLEADTIIGSKKYRQIRYIHEYENIINAYRGAIRQSEDGQQVYYIPWGSNNEYLLYNFDVKQGDIVHAYAGFNDISCEEMAEPDRSITPAWTVMSVQTINGRKHISVQNEEYGITIEWIEGIGTPHILWPQGRTCYATGMEVQTERTLCTADNEGNILYSFNTDDLGIRNECPNWHSADTTTPANDVRCTKVLIDGQLYIRLGDKTYTLTGIQVK